MENYNDYLKKLEALSQNEATAKEAQELRKQLVEMEAVYAELQNFYFIHQSLIQNFKGVDNQFKMWLNKDTFNAQAVKSLLPLVQNYIDILYDLQGIMDNLGSNQYAKEWQDKIDLCYANCVNKMLLPQVNTYLKQIQDLLEKNNTTVHNNESAIKKVINWRDEYDQFSEVDENLFVAGKNGLYGVVDKEGKVIVPCNYELCNRTEFGFIICKNGKYGFTTTDGIATIRCEYDYIQEQRSRDYRFYFTLLEVQKNNKCGFIDHLGKIEAHCKYDSVSILGVYYILVELNHRKGIIESDSLIIPIQYDYIQWNEDNDYFIVRQNNREGIISNKGLLFSQKDYRTILPCTYDIGSCYGYSDGYGAKQNRIYLEFDSNGRQKP